MTRHTLCCLHRFAAALPHFIRLLPLAHLMTELLGLVVYVKVHHLEAFRKLDFFACYEMGGNLCYSYGTRKY